MPLNFWCNARVLRKKNNYSASLASMCSFLVTLVLFGHTSGVCMVGCTYPMCLFRISSAVTVILLVVCRLMAVGTDGVILFCALAPAWYKSLHVHLVN